MARWTWIVANLDGQPMAELTMAQDRKLDFARADAASATWTIDGTHWQATYIHELTTDLLVYRDDELLFRGRIGSSSDEIDADGHKVSCSAVDYRGMLEARIIAHEIAFPDMDRWAIAVILLDWAQRAADGGRGPENDLGIVAGPNELTPLIRSGHITAEDTNAERAISDIAESLEGFDWWVDPYKRFRAADPRGREHPDFPLVYGTTVTKVSRQVDTTTYGNRIRQRGGQVEKPDDERIVAQVQNLPAPQMLYDAWWVGDTEGKLNERQLFVWMGQSWVESEDMPVPYADRYAPDLATRTEKRIDRVFSNGDDKTQAMTDASADYNLARYGNLVPSYKMTLRNDIDWWSPTQCWIGDAHPFMIRSGRLDAAGTERVEELSISVDENGTETVDVTLGRKRSDLMTWFKTVPERIDRLERR